MSFRWLKPYLPRNLYGRAILILLMPVVTVLLVVSVVFIQRHFEGVTEQMTRSVSREVRLILDEAGQSGPIAQTLEIAITPIPRAELPREDSRRWYDFTGSFVIRYFDQLLPGLVAVDLPDDRSVHLYFDRPQGALKLSFDRRRVSASNPHQLLVNMVVFGGLMTVVAYFYLRNQLRPITRLARAAEMLALVGLAEAGAKRPHELSGGQRQRVALARCLAVEPEVLLLDEPLGALDLKLRRAMQDELKAIQRQVGTTFVHVTHDQEEAMAIADRIVVMNAGRIEDEGAPRRIYREPRTLFAAGFMGEINRIPARAVAGRVETPFGPLPAAPPAEGGLVACLRPEAVSPAPAPFAIGRARVRDAAFFGTYCRAHLVPEAAPDLTLVAHLPPDAVPEEGAVLTLYADPAALAVFPEE